jgi:putative acyl-CoA dehydrogenase
MRLKDKLADRANASSEVEYHGAFAQMLGEEGRGVKTIIDMVQSTRLDCVLGSVGGCRRALQHMLNYTVREMHSNLRYIDCACNCIGGQKQRKTFGASLVHHPMMANLLADFCMEFEFY